MQLYFEIKQNNLWVSYLNFGGGRIRTISQEQDMIDTAASQTSSFNCIGVFFLNWWHPSGCPQCPIRQKTVNSSSSSQRSFLIILLCCQSVRLAWLFVNIASAHPSICSNSLKKCPEQLIALEYYLLKKKITMQIFLLVELVSDNDKFNFSVEPVFLRIIIIRTVKNFYNSILFPTHDYDRHNFT